MKVIEKQASVKDAILDVVGKARKKRLIKVKLFCLWISWLLIGTVFYASKTDFGWAKGFYMAVNVGYSIGWGYPVEPNDKVIWFSIFYVLSGASAVAAALGYFAQSMLDQREEWYKNAELEEKHRGAMQYGNFRVRLTSWLTYNMGRIKPILVWAVWIIWAIIWSCYYIDWSFTQGVYFAVSSLSTGGLWAIPHDAADAEYFIAGLFAATGIPIMAFAMANLASFFIVTNHPHDTDKTIRAKMTREELQMMERFGLENGDGEVDRAEFIVLCMVRLGAATPDLVQRIIDRFVELDSSKDGILSYKELLEEEEDTSPVHNKVSRRKSSSAAKSLQQLEENAMPAHNDL